MKYPLTTAIFISSILFAAATATAQIAPKPTPDPAKATLIAPKPTLDPAKATLTAPKPTQAPPKAPLTATKPAQDTSKPAATATKPAPDPSNALLQQTLIMQRFAVEMARLRLEVTELKIELQQVKIAGLENELRQVQIGKKDLEIRRVEFRPETAQTGQQVNTFLPKAELQAGAEKAPEKLRTEEQHLLLSKREMELSKQVREERAYLQELKEQQQKLNRLCEMIASK